ncbi:hypothetical protein DR64_4001 [Paraburkholderia xenovorans LB400]|uniref:Uncharacterized protein n=1 Tax=Paraburkholderia xenovorans (strain LB400) TaxID=266265 RepID=Q13XR6_PARXL|nr:hypothetical protein [Paraburkholderia xenovorans]ABE31123.1 Conserved hypothetical protein [Paraburkholderia xenovorans LB400]AIP33332.1 hypothetical protein DR64_4001 [Paraburkholderia xenovorans LB400]NPT36854.1 hypothetical protein [Paraburkholderia xenovorans]
MGLTTDLDGVRHAYGLCFVRVPWAYFTRLPLTGQWGDGWERAPYEQHAGLPYEDAAQQILTVAFDGPLLPPDAGYDGRARSVNEINRGDAPWLRTQDFINNAPVRIAAGVSLERFVELVELAGGHVFAPLGWGSLRLAPVEPDGPSGVTKCGHRPDVA